MFVFNLEVPTLYSEEGEVLSAERLEIYRSLEPPHFGTVVFSNGEKYLVEKVHYFKSKRLNPSGPIGLITLMDEETWETVKAEIATVKLKQSWRDLCIGLLFLLVIFVSFFVGSP